MTDRWIDVHSVTCAICGDLADERETLPLDPWAMYEASPESFEAVGRALAARELHGEGEVHPECLEDESRWSM